MSAQYNVDHTVVKKPGNDVPLTKDQEDKWMHYADNPMDFFTEQCYVRGSKGKRLFEPRDYQSDLLDVVIGNTHVVATAPRQSGKCCHQDSLVRVKINGTEYKMKLGDFHEYIAGRKGLTECDVQ